MTFIHVVDIVTSDISHVKINIYLYVQNVSYVKQLYIFCPKCRMRYDSHKVILMVVNYMWKPDYFSQMIHYLVCKKIFFLIVIKGSYSIVI